MTEHEIKNLINSIDLNHDFGQRNKTIIEILYGTGIRVSELINLKLSNIFFKENIIKVIGKGNKERSNKLGRETLNKYCFYLRKRTKAQKGPLGKFRDTVPQLRSAGLARSARHLRPKFTKQCARKLRLNISESYLFRTNDKSQK